MNVEEVKVWGVDEAPARKPKRGDLVVIPKGAHITGTFSIHNPARSPQKVAGRTYTIRVSWYEEHEGNVTWAGTGGYWHRTVEWVWSDTDQS